MCISKSVSIFMFTVEMNTSVVLGSLFISSTDLVSKFEGVMLNAHCVEVSVVNNDASTPFVYSVCCCSVSASESSCCEVWSYVYVHCGFVSTVLTVVSCV